jgi:plastocyanin
MPAACDNNGFLEPRPMPAETRSTTRRGAVIAPCLVAIGVVFTVACGGGTSEPAPAAPPAPTENPVDAATAAAISGTITFAGTAPAPDPINMASDPFCADRNRSPATARVVVDGKGGLQNVFVHVKDGLGTLRFPVPSTPVVLDQRNCAYVPHVFGIQVGQPLEILNSDATLHNIHAMPEANREFNRGQSAAGQKDTHIFSAAEVMVPFKCDVHRWMNAWVGILDHPFFAVTGADGTFTLKGLPPGTYTIEAWHETLGRRTAQVTLGASQTGSVSFTFEAS